jgi:hypothetical protein
MAYARLAMFPGGTEDQARTVAEELGQSNIDPPGRILFGAGPVEDGYQIIQVWETRADLDSFLESSFRPAMQRLTAAGRGWTSPPVVVDVELHDLIH